MSKKKEMTDDLMKELIKCRGCRYCVDACPTYQASDGLESLSPYGRVQIIKYLFSGTLNADDALFYAIYTCAGCGNCSIVCKSKSAGLEVSELIRLGRVQLFKEYR